MQNQLVSRNVTVNGRRTSLRLEAATWEAFDQICSCEQLSPHEVVSMVEAVRGQSSRTSTVRAFIITYFRFAANHGGHPKAGTAERALQLFS